MSSALDEAVRVANAVFFDDWRGCDPVVVRQDRLRRLFGVLLPPASASTTNEPSRNRLECLLAEAAGATLRIRLRFVHVRSTTVHDSSGRPLGELTVNGVRLRPQDEGLLREIDAEFPVAELGGPRTAEFDVPDEFAVDPVVGGSVRRRCRALAGRLEVSATPVPGVPNVVRLRVDVMNDSHCPLTADRDMARRTAFLAAHSLLAVDTGEFVSVSDPPQWAAALTQQLCNTHTWPVLAGPAGRRDVVLGSPIVLPDHPRVTVNTDDPSASSHSGTAEPGASHGSRPNRIEAVWS